MTVQNFFDIILTLLVFLFFIVFFSLILNTCNTAETGQCFGDGARPGFDTGAAFGNRCKAYIGRLFFGTGCLEGVYSGSSGNFGERYI